MLTYKTLYEYDTSGRMRVWWMEQANDQYRTVSGLEDGKKVESAWKVAKPKNVGKSNATTGEQQAKLEIESLYTKRIKMGAAYSLEELKNKPIMFDPMLAIKYQDVKKLVFPVWSQPKLDGYRCATKADGMWSRGREKIISAPHIFEELKPVFEKYPTIVLDGELYNHLLKNDFNKLSSMLAKTVNLSPIVLAESAELVEYHVYDMYIPTRPESPFCTRHAALQLLMKEFQFKKIKLVDKTEVKSTEEIDELFNSYLMDNYEGQMIRLDGIYEQGKRSKSLIKNKNFEDGEFIVLDILEGKGNWAGKAKSVVLQMPNGKTSDAGIRGDEAYLAQVLANKHLYIGKPAKVRFQNWTPDGKLRMGIVIELNRTM